LKIYPNLKEQPKGAKFNLNLTAMKRQIIRPEFDHAFIYVDTYMRFHLYDALAPLMNDSEYWHYLGYCYSQSDDLYNAKDKVKKCFSSKRPYRYLLMGQSERKFLKNLPDTFTIYRGMTREEYDSGDFGISWTLDKDQGHFFAFVYIRNHSTAHMPKVVVRATVKKSAVIAYFEGSEKEIIAVEMKHGDLTDVAVVEES